MVSLAALPWQLTCLLFVSLATATISPSNVSTENPTLYHGTLPLAEDDGGTLADLIPLTTKATSQIEGNLYYTTFANANNISTGEIAYISCNPSDYTGFATAQKTFALAYQTANISGAILYSTATNYCNYTQSSNQDMIQNFAVYSMTNKQDSATVLAQIDNLPAHMKFFVNVDARGDGSDGSGNGTGYSSPNPLGPSPSTAVAMIILYSITGIITALFLVIIITGAVRAHRHPERYGPRNVLGRPRQSRARGLGRAILDTIPIVKFGEKEPAKPADVELGSTAEATSVNAAPVADSEAQTTQAVAGTGATDDVAPKTTIGAAETSQEQTRSLGEEHQEGIAPAQPLAAGIATATDNDSSDEHLGCSICTEDFEKGQDLRVLPCNHKFHPECVDPWLLNVSGTCPLCRVDLRPVTSHDSAARESAELAPPLNPETETSHRRRSALRDILSLRQRPNASAEERISALRRLREQRRNGSGDVAETNNASLEDVGSSAAVARDGRRSRRISARLSGVLSGRARRERREESPVPQIDSQHPRSDASPARAPAEAEAADSNPAPSESRN